MELGEDITYQFNPRTRQLELSKIRIYSTLASKIPGSIDLTVGEPDFDTPEHIRQAAKNAIDHSYTHYTATAGILELREAIAEKLRKQNSIIADPNDQVIVTVGAAEAIALATRVLLTEGDEVIVSDPAYDMYIPNIQLAGAVPVRMALSKPNFTVDLVKLEGLITNRTRLIILNSPNNPTGSVLGIHELQGILDIAVKRNLLVLSDEVYEALVYDSSHHVSFASLEEGFPRCISVFSFSKTYAMTGWRIGYVTAPSEIISRMAKLHRNMVVHPSTIAQMAALTALTGPQDSVPEMAREFDKRRLFMLSTFEQLQIPCSRPKGAFYLFPYFGEFGNRSDVVAENLAKQQGVVTVPGSAFGSSGEGHLRVSYSTSMNKLASAHERFVRWAGETRRIQTSKGCIGRPSETNYAPGRQ
jgi:aminotransferase